MEENERLSMKRKDFDRVNDEFSDFSLSSPARKIRRLVNSLAEFFENPRIRDHDHDDDELVYIILIQDVDLPPIMEEDEIDLPMQDTSAEEIELEPVNDERAIVLFKPLHYQQPSSGNLFVDRDLISGFKSKFLSFVDVMIEPMLED